MAMSPSFDVAGWFANGPGVFRKIGGVLLDGSGDIAPIVELIVADDAFAEADPDVQRMLHRSLARMSGALPRALHERIAPESLDAWFEIFRILQAHEIWKVYGAFVERHKPNLGPGIRDRFAFAATVSADDARVANEKRTEASRYLHARLRAGTIMALPAAPCIAPPIDISADDQVAFRRRTFRLTSITGLAGLPQVVIPAGTVSGCPIGLSFIGWQGSDEILLDLAVTLARFVGTADA
jgi:amidase